MWAVKRGLLGVSESADREFRNPIGVRCRNVGLYGVTESADMLLGCDLVIFLAGQLNGYDCAVRVFYQLRQTTVKAAGRWSPLLLI